MLAIDCRSFKAEILATLAKHRKDMEDHLIARFKTALDAELVKNRDLWRKATEVHTDIDEIIAQVELVN